MKPAENEILIRHGALSLFPFFLWCGWVEIKFDGKEYNRALPYRLSKKKAKADAKAFAESIKTDMLGHGFNEVWNKSDEQGN